MNAIQFFLKSGQSFGVGFALPFRALKLILSKPILLFWSALPIGITVYLFFTWVPGLQFLMSDFLLNSFQFFGVTPASIPALLMTSLVWLLKLLVLILAAFTFSFATTLVAVPFNDFLAESSEKWMQPPLPPAPQASLLQKLKFIWIDFLKTLAAVAAGFFVLLFSWVPILNLFAFLISFLLVAFQYVSYPQTRRGVSLREGIRFLKQHFSLCLGFGFSISVLFMIPLLWFVALPLAVVGGTWLTALAETDS